MRHVIVALGASNTAGYGVGPHEAFPAVLARSLSERSFAVDMRNAGVPGRTTGEMLTTLEKTVPVGTGLVIFQPGSNDLRRGISQNVRELNIAAIHNRLAARGILVFRVAHAFAVASVAHLQADGVHFTPSGHRVIAEQIVDDIAAALSALEHALHQRQTADDRPSRQRRD